ncbi:hypothetical protein HDC93_002920 [Streptomyces sp. AK010]|nr:hypothetical protein [Streptomyces sp. AK010]
MTEIIEKPADAMETGTPAQAAAPAELAPDL